MPLLRGVMILTAFLLMGLTGQAVANSDMNGDGWSDVANLYDYGGANTGAWTFLSNGTVANPVSFWSSGPGNWDSMRSTSVTGKFDADNLDDQVVLYDYGNSSTGIWLLHSDGANFAPSLAWASGAGNWDWSRSKIAAGDFDNDGMDELYVLYDYGDSCSGLWIFRRTGTAFTPELVWASGPGNWDWGRSKIAVTDFDNDGFDDVAVIYDYGRFTIGAWALKSNGATVAPALIWASGVGNWDWNRSRLVAGNFSGDADGDLGIFYRYDNNASGLWLFQSNGTTASPALAWASGAGNWDYFRSKITAGNFTGDAHDDIAVLYDYGSSKTGLWYLRSDGMSAAPSLAWVGGAGSWDWTRTKLANTGTATVRDELSDFIIGYSVLGLPIRATKVGNGHRRYLFIGAHHGDEPQGGRILELFRDYLLSHPGSVPVDAEVWIVPNLNPDGVSARTRWNARGVNLNRNYWTNNWNTIDVTSLSTLALFGLPPLEDMTPVATGTPFTDNYPGPSPFSEPETVAIAGLCANTPFRAMISIHDPEGRVYWGQTGSDLAYLFGGLAGLPVAGPISASGDATRWFGQATGKPSITIELTAAQADGSAAYAFEVYKNALLATLNY